MCVCVCVYTHVHVYRVYQAVIKGVKMWRQEGAGCIQRTERQLVLPRSMGEWTGGTWRARQGPAHMATYLPCPRTVGRKEERHDQICILEAHSGGGVLDRLYDSTGGDRRRQREAS